MNIFYEEDGAFKVGAILTDNTTSLQVESMHGKRSKIKEANVLLRFAQPGLAEFMAQAGGIAADIDVEFLWECSPADEFGFDALASAYLALAPRPIEADGTLIRLHSSPMHFYKKGKDFNVAFKEELPLLGGLTATLDDRGKQALLSLGYRLISDETVRFILPQPGGAHKRHLATPRLGNSDDFLVIRGKNQPVDIF